MRTPDPVPERPPSSAGPSLRPPFGGDAAPLQSADLLKGRKSIAIEHQGVVYRLQATRLGKLILTK